MKSWVHFQTYGNAKIITTHEKIYTRNLRLSGRKSFDNHNMFSWNHSLYSVTLKNPSCYPISLSGRIVCDFKHLRERKLDTGYCSCLDLVITQIICIHMWHLCIYYKYKVSDRYTAELWSTIWHMIYRRWFLKRERLDGQVITLL